MFDGGEIASEQERSASYEQEWRSVHERLREISTQRVQLEAEESTYLLEAEDLHVFRRLGYRTMVEYMVGELGYTRHAANERLRIPRELPALPQIAAAYRSGELCFSKVRELTRVATPTTEAAFLAAAEGKDSHQVAKLVSGLTKGDLPGTPPNPALVTRRVVFDLHAEALSMLSWRTRLLREELGREPSHDEVIMALCIASVADGKGSPTGDRVRENAPTAEEDGSAAEPAGPELAETEPAETELGGTESGETESPEKESAEGEPAASESGGETVEKGRRRPTVIPPPWVRHVVMTCKHCDRSELVVDGEGLVVDRATAERLCCDVEDLGDLDSDDRTRVTSEIPAAIRRKVFIRDKFQCQVPGCTATCFLDVHHIRHRKHGGTHTMSNLLVLCFHHHKCHHDGLLEITGTAPHRLEFSWRRDDDDLRDPTWDRECN